MTDKQAYAGLLERLRRLPDPPLYAGAVPRTELVNPDGPEAAEVISSLLKALEPFARLQLPARREGNAAVYSILHKHILAARAALNSDAPLSIGEGQ